MPEFRALLDGYRRFRTGPYQAQRLRYDALSLKGQAPRVMVIACSDSRVDPSAIFDTEPGQMFVVRNVANLVPPFETGGGMHGVSAALEFAVTQIEVHHIVVMGHAQCGGVAASLSGRFADAPVGDGYFIGRWMSMLDAERNRVVEVCRHHPDLDPQRTLEQAAVRVSLTNLRSFPCVREREDNGTLKLHGAYFGIADGVLHLLDPADERFKPVPLEIG